MKTISICRTCDTTEFKNARFHLKERVKGYPEILTDMLQEFVKIELPEIIAEQLPQYMCEGCTQRLLAAYDFVAQVRDATELMMKQLIKDEPTVASECFQESPMEHCSRPSIAEQTVTEADAAIPDATQSTDLAEDDEFLKADVTMLKKTLDSLDIELLCDDIKQEIDESLDDVPLVNFANKKKSKKSKQLNSNSKISRKNTDSYASSEPFKCDICEKVFKKHGILKIHRLTHTGEKRFKCEFCEKAFTQICSMKAHRRTHTGEKPFKCDLCKKSFRQSGHLKNHRLKHTEEKPFKCDMNKKQCGRPRVHQRNGEKLFKCDFCKRTFSQSCNLKTHQLTHTGEKPFKCDLCEQTFTQKVNMKRHRLKHTK